MTGGRSISDESVNRISFPQGGQAVKAVPWGFAVIYMRIQMMVQSVEYEEAVVNFANTIRMTR